jgi:large subunit ribosomal protein L22
LLERSQKHKRMDIIAKSTSVRVSPRKVRLIADAVRNLPLEEALVVLATVKKRGAVGLEKTLKSAIANAIANKNLQRDNLMIKTIDVLDGPAFKRYHPSTRGRIHPYKKRTSNITIVLAEKVEQKIEKAVEEKGVSSKPVAEKTKTK